MTGAAGEAGAGKARDDLTESPQAIERALEGARHGRTPEERRRALGLLLDSLLASSARGRDDPLVALLAAVDVVEPDELRPRIESVVAERERAGDPLLTEAESEALQALLLARVGAL